MLPRRLGQRLIGTECVGSKQRLQHFGQTENPRVGGSISAPRHHPFRFQINVLRFAGSTSKEGTTRPWVTFLVTADFRSRLKMTGADASGEIYESSVEDLGSLRTKPQPNHKCDAAAARRCPLRCLSGALRRSVGCVGYPEVRP